MNFKNKLAPGIGIGTGVILFICVVAPFLREKYLYRRLGDVDIAPMLIQDGDLPHGFIAGDVNEFDPDYYKSARAQEQKIFATDGSEVGSVSIYLVASASEQSEMYSIYTQVESQEGIIPYKVAGFGDQSSVFSISGCDIRVVFTRCTAVGYIELYAACNQKEYDIDSLIEHAKRLDESLKSTVCY